MIERLKVILGLAAAPALIANKPNLELAQHKAAKQIASMERLYGGRLGVAILNRANNRVITHRGNERFALCSTHKFHSVVYILSRVDCGLEQLDRRVRFSTSDLVDYSPITARFAGNSEITVAQLCEAALTVSDNTAANLLLDSFGGPQALTIYLRSIGDCTTRLDRREPNLNEATPGDPRDTTTPLATLRVMEKTIIGAELSPRSRAALAKWMIASKSGSNRIRAGAPNSWLVGDKTGTGNYNVTNDIAVIWPDHRRPIIVTAYYAESSFPLNRREAVLAEIGRLACNV